MILNHIEEFRRRKGVSKSHLARQIHVCPSFVTMIEKQERQPSIEVMFRLVKYFKCRVEELFEDCLERTGG